MFNVAFGKSTVENYKNSSVITNGQITGYTGGTGYCQFRWPANLTVDLETIYNLNCIRFLLWDGLGAGEGQRDPRTYKYRLLTSVDRKTWHVLYSSDDQGFNGWQVFRIPAGVEAQFIRIHGLWNSANPMFHVVELQAYEQEPESLNAEIILEKVITTQETPVEINEHLPIHQNFQYLITRLEKIVHENPVLNPEPIQEIIHNLSLQVRDIAAIENSLESIKRHITEPVQRELEKASELGIQSIKLGRFSFWGFWVGLVGGILAIVSIVMYLFAR